jgi:hypothetical protein
MIINTVKIISIVLVFLIVPSVMTTSHLDSQSGCIFVYADFGKASGLPFSVQLDIPVLHEDDYDIFLFDVMRPDEKINNEHYSFISTFLVEHPPRA